jgi:hypothetical protein
MSACLKRPPHRRPESSSRPPAGRPGGATLPSRRGGSRPGSRRAPSRRSAATRDERRSPSAEIAASRWCRTPCARGPGPGRSRHRRLLHQPRSRSDPLRRRGLAHSTSGRARRSAGSLGRCRAVALTKVSISGRGRLRRPRVRVGTQVPWGPPGDAPQPARHGPSAIAPLCISDAAARGDGRVALVESRAGAEHTATLAEPWEQMFPFRVSGVRIARKFSPPRMTHIQGRLYSGSMSMAMRTRTPCTSFALSAPSGNLARRDEAQGMGHGSRWSDVLSE